MKSNRDIAYEVILRALADCNLTPDDADMCLADVRSDYRVICEALETMRRQVPEGLSVMGSLDLSGCTGLTALPDGLSVGGSLVLTGCTGLTALPDGLSVGGSLDLSGCNESLLLDAKARGFAARVRS